MIENGIIESADICFSRGCFLDCNLSLRFDGTGQGFGGWVLGGNPFDTTTKAADHKSQTNLAADFIGGMMAIADVDCWSKMKGKVIRVERETDFGPIIAVGHAVKDRWYRPKERMELLAGGVR